MNLSSKLLSLYFCPLVHNNCFGVVRDARRKIRLEPLKETSVGEAGIQSLHSMVR